MAGRIKIASAIIIVFVLIFLSYYFFFMEDDVEVELKRAPDFEFYDLEEFLDPGIEEQKRSLSDYRGSIIVLSFIDVSSPDGNAQNNETVEAYGEFPEVQFITIDADRAPEGPIGLNNIRSQYGYNWTFTFDSENAIMESYDIISLPAVVIIDEEGYGTFSEERFVDSEELATNLDKVKDDTAKRINVGRIPGVKKAPDFSWLLPK